MRRYAREHRALFERVSDQTEVVALEIAEPAVNELRRSRGRRAREITLLDKADGKSAAGCIPRDAAAIDPPADDGDVVREKAQTALLKESAFPLELM